MARPRPATPLRRARSWAPVLVAALIPLGCGSREAERTTGAQAVIPPEQYGADEAMQDFMKTSSPASSR